MKFITIPKDGLSISEFDEQLDKAGVTFEKFVLKIRKNFRPKLRKARAESGHGNCECCGSYRTMRITVNGETRYFDSHLGKAWIYPSDFI